jgi:anti-anti-sigma factor
VSGLLQLSREGDVVILTPDVPCLDNAVAAGLRHEIGRLDLAGAADCMLNLASVDLVDSSGIGVLLALQRKIEAGQGRLRVLNPPETLVRTLTLLQLDQTLLSPG